MSSRAIEAACVAALALLITILVAAPVLVAPSQRIFGLPLVGHHHDPFTFMQQIDRPLVAGPYLQPATDAPAAFAARAAGPIAAHNGIILLTFPLAAVCAFLLARYLGIAPVWAALASLAFAFSPFHLAHAAYHPHIAQTQWIALYLLALWRCLDRPTRAAMLLLAFAAGAVVLSNFYGGLIAAAVTPIAVVTYWFCNARLVPRPAAHLAMTAGVLLALATAGAGYAAFMLGGPDGSHAAPPDDLVRYSAHWWSYLMPPAAHPVLGALVQQRWHDAGVDVGLLEQQVSLGWGVVALAAVPVVTAIYRPSRLHAAANVPVLAAVALVALVCSLAGPASLMHQVVPMFRAYARFGVVVQLMVALLAAIGAEQLWRGRTRPTRAVCVALLTVAVAEYAVWPPSMSRPVLPTRAHQWAAASRHQLRVLDCAPEAGDTAAIHWLTRYRVTSYTAQFGDCTEPNLPERLAAAGYTHLLIRRETPEGRWLEGRRTPDGLQGAAHFRDSDVFAIAALAPVGIEQP